MKWEKLLKASSKNTKEERIKSLVAHYVRGMVKNIYFDENNETNYKDSIVEYTHKKVVSIRDCYKAVKDCNIG